MKKTISLFTILAGAILMLGLQYCTPSKAANQNTITFYKVPLVCGAAPEIGCGSRLKPLFIQAGKTDEIKEAWSNRKGTVIAIVWNTAANEDIARKLFKQHSVKASLINDENKRAELKKSMESKDEWYKGMDVDKLSIEEAGVIAHDLTSVALDSGLITKDEAEKVKNQLREYFKKELVIVRTNEELGSEKTQGKWRKDGYDIYVSVIGKSRADKVSKLYSYNFSNTEDCDTKGRCEKDDHCCEKK